MAPSTKRLSPLGVAAAGAAAAVTANLITFPLDVVATRLQVQSKHLSRLLSKEQETSTGPHRNYANQIDALIRIAREEGLPGLYSGLAAGLTQTLSSNFAYFYFYSVVRRAYLRFIHDPRRGAPPGTAIELFLGALAGAISRSITTPISVLTTRQQTSSNNHKNNKRGSVWDTLGTLLREEGPLALWRGLGPSLILTSNPAITYGLFERLKGLILARRRTTTTAAVVAFTPGEIFLMSMFTKALATVLTYPYIFAKVRLQWRPPTEEELLVVDEAAASSSSSDGKKAAIRLVTDVSVEERAQTLEMLRYKGTYDVMKKVVATEGIMGLFNGLPAQLMKAVLTQGILAVSKDMFEAWTLAAINLLEDRQ